MSMLFIGMFYRRKTSKRSPKGQSISVALCKMIGTSSAAILCLIVMGSDMVVILFGSACFIMDLIYLRLLVRKFGIKSFLK
jgi:amino acid transporter